MNPSFNQLKTNKKLFFDILPKDWQDQLLPYWEQYDKNSEIYVISENDRIIGGGIIFSKCPPDLDYFEKEANLWFEQQYLYIGYLFILETERNRNLGSFWLDELKRHHPEQKFWLIIEDEHLHRFYQKNNFTFYKTISYNQLAEYLYCYTP